jgi:lipopolysaccharide transport system permease protein
MLASLWRSRNLLLTLVRRQYQLRYRQSAAGVAWALLPVLGLLAVGSVLFNQLLGVDTGGADYEAFAMAALVPWTFFANSLTGGIPSIAGSLNMVTRLSFPRAVLPLSMVGLSMLDLAIAAAGFVVVAYVFGSGLPLTGLWAPLILLIEIPLIVGVVLLGSAVNVFARDVRLAVPLLVQLWLFLTPVLYSLGKAPEGIRTLLMANPMTGIVVSFRRVLVYGEAPTMTALLPSLIGAAVFFLVGVWYFGAVERRFADVI